MELDVTYIDGEPRRIEYFHMVYGLVRFEVDGDTAVIDEEWDEVDHSTLKDGFEPQVFTDDVIREVKELPFVESVVVESYNDE